MAPAAMLAPQVLLDTEKPVLAAMLVKLRDVPIRFVSVTVLAELVLPTVTVPRFKLPEENVTGALPVPVRLTVWGLFPASSVNVSVPVAVPVAMGENVTPTVQVAPAAILDPQVLLAIKKPALVTIPVPVKLRATFW